MTQQGWPGSGAPQNPHGQGSSLPPHQPGQPQPGQPHGQPHGQPQFGQPQFGQPQFGQPGQTQPGQTQPQGGAGGQWQPQYGQTQRSPQGGSPPYGPGQPQFGQPQPGQPQAGQPQFGQRPPAQFAAQAPTAQPKKRTGLIVGVAIALVLVVVVIAAALNGNGGSADPTPSRATSGPASTAPASTAPASTKPAPSNGGSVAPTSQVLILGKTPPETVGDYRRAPGTLNDNVTITYRNPATLEGATLLAFADRAGDTDIGPALANTVVVGSFLCGVLESEEDGTMHTCYTTAADGTLVAVTPAEIMTIAELANFSNEVLNGLE